jgi:outer membrane lipoprotein carrier protein
MKTLCGIAALLLASASGPLSVQERATTAEQAAAALQAKYDTVRDFSADFTHRYEGGVLRRTRVETGTLLVKKPGRMRWTYKTPEEKLFVSDGSRIYFYERESNQVTVAPVPEEDEATTAALFLAGKGNLVKDFRASFAADGPAGVWALRLDPVRPQSEYDWLEVQVDRRTLQILQLTAADAQGGRSTFTFTNIKENIGLADKLFAFSIPRGAVVTHAGRANR